MMKGFNFEKNLPHQVNAVTSTLSVFTGADVVMPQGVDKLCINPVLDRKFKSWYADNIKAIQADNGISESVKRTSNLIDIMMETGTGKTYTYTKTIFELNKNFGIFKFIVVVPTLSIKAGTINFLKSASSREHFKQQYGKTIKLHIVESQKSRNKKSYLPSAVTSFVNASSFERNHIQVMIINAGMINSDTMQKSFDRGLFDKYTIPFDAISVVKPFMIIDEPHKFSQANKTWENLQKMSAQYILRYGATFPEKTFKQKNHSTGKMDKIKVKDYHNLIYTLTSVDAFNQNLVKGVIGHITEFEQGKNALIKLLGTDGKEARFELTEHNNENTNRKKVAKQTQKLAKQQSLVALHPAMSDLTVDRLNKSTVVLSNGLEMKVGDKINPYSYAQTLQEMMLQKAVQQHFELEKQLLTREVKIKPLTLFFIDNIEEYRSDTGYIKTALERLIKAEATQRLEVECDPFYISYLKQTLADVAMTHGGYFSKDNSEKDEAIEQEVNEILHDKHALLQLDNPRRFIFSKWTLREGWDNPNVFQICKLRSSGSDISKLQEVGRGLRLPVNEYGNRVKDEQFYLNYFVDFTESGFVDSLVAEINAKSGAVAIDNPPDKLNETLITTICQTYHIDEGALLDILDNNNAITRSNHFKDDGWAFITQTYPLAFNGVGADKVRLANQNPPKITIRTQKYHELKTLWEKLNEKVILEYNFADESEFLAHLVEFFAHEPNNFTYTSFNERSSKLHFADDHAYAEDSETSINDEITPVSTMTYSEFLQSLATAMQVNIKTLHQALTQALGMINTTHPAHLSLKTADNPDALDINQYLNHVTIRNISQNFKAYLLANAIDTFAISYKKVSNRVHPTKLTDAQGEVLHDIDNKGVTAIGRLYSDDKVADSYLFNELYYDSDLEKQNIMNDIKEVVVFTKIPQNSIKIPVAGGGSYSPDFAYVIHHKNGQKKLNLVVETKGKQSEAMLNLDEKQKIRHAKQLFSDELTVVFKTQLNHHKMLDLIKEALQ